MESTLQCSVVKAIHADVQIRLAAVGQQLEKRVFTDVMPLQRLEGGDAAAEDVL